MTLEPIIATVNGAFLKREYTPPFDSYLVINQVEKPSQITHNTAPIFSYQEQGLSKSRNRALAKTTADICLISDDDIVFLAQSKTIILTAFQKNPSADIITFQAQTPAGRLFKQYMPQQKWHNTRSILRTSSWEIAFKRQSILSADLQFDERFGLGADFPTGEENIFLLDALRSGLKILYVPIPIVIHPEIHSGGDFQNTALISAKGAMFYRMFGTNAYLVCLLFAYRKYRFSTMGFIKFYQLMCRGILDYKIKGISI